MNFNSEILTTASTFKLDPDLIAAQVHVESGNNPWAWNPEPLYKYLWDVQKNRPFRMLMPAEVSSEIPPTDFPCLAGARDQEWWAQQASWGLLQIMGAVARENGFKGPYLAELCDPIVNLSIGCNHLAQLMLWAKGNTIQALAAYNGGKKGNTQTPFRNQAYADRVLKARKALVGSEDPDEAIGSVSRLALPGATSPGTDGCLAIADRQFA